MYFNFLPGLLTGLLIPVLVLIHSLRNRPRPARVTTLFIWESVVREQRRALFLVALRQNVSLVLQILIVALLALALAGPVLRLEKKEARRHIVILDTSASMATRTGSGTRFDAAVKAALEILTTLPDRDAVMMMAAGPSPRILLPFSRDKAALARAVRSISPTDAPSTMADAVFLALSFFSGNRDGRIFLVSDGTGYDAGAVTAMSPAVTPVPVTGGTKNMAITRFGFRPLPGRRNACQILVGLHNFSKIPMVSPLEIRTGGRVVGSREIGLDAGEARTVILPFEGEVTHFLNARIRVVDDLDADNQAWAVAPPREKAHLFLVSKGNHFLETLLDVLPDVALTQSRDMPGPAWDRITQRNHIVILDGFGLPKGSSGNFLLINTTGPDLPLAVDGRIDHPEITDWDSGPPSGSPIMAGVNPEGLLISSALGIIPGPGVIPLVESNGIPLIFTFFNTEVKTVTLGFDLNQSDLPLRVAFPVIMKNIFQWLHPLDTGYRASASPTGAPLRIPVETDQAQVAVRTPLNQWEKTAAPKGTYTFTRTDTAGMYRVKTGQTRRWFAVNLCNPEESNILKTFPPLPAEKTEPDPAADSPVKAAVELWGICLLGALLLALAEGLLWVRKECAS